MKNIALFLIFASVLICMGCNEPNPPRILIAGDSTAQGYDTAKTTMRGWGQILPELLDERIEVLNHAKAGRSTKSFQDEARWDTLIAHTQKGDYVLIQFSHNDTSTKPERHASPEDFRRNLIRFINDVRAKEAHPVLLTSLVMRTFQDGNLVDNRLKTYPGIVRSLAREYNVPLIDVNLHTRDLILLLGDENSKALYVENDDTHTNEAGARAVAEIIAEGLKDLGLK